MNFALHVGQEVIPWVADDIVLLLDRGEQGGVVEVLAAPPPAGGAEHDVEEERLIGRILEVLVGEEDFVGALDEALVVGYLHLQVVEYALQAVDAEFHAGGGGHDVRSALRPGDGVAVAAFVCRPPVAAADVVVEVMHLIDDVGIHGEAVVVAAFGEVEAEGDVGDGVGAGAADDVGRVGGVRPATVGGDVAGGGDGRRAGHGGLAVAGAVFAVGGGDGDVVALVDDAGVEVRLRLLVEGGDCLLTVDADGDLGVLEPGVIDFIVEEEDATADTDLDGIAVGEEAVEDEQGLGLMALELNGLLAADEQTL